MKSDAAMLNLEDGATPIRNPSTAAEDARLASLISLDGILKQVKVFIFIWFLLFLMLLRLVVRGARNRKFELSFDLTGYNEANLC